MPFIYFEVAKTLFFLFLLTTFETITFKLVTLNTIINKIVKMTVKKPPTARETNNPENLLITEKTSLPRIVVGTQINKQAVTVFKKDQSIIFLLFNILKLNKLVIICINPSPSIIAYSPIYFGSKIIHKNNFQILFSF